MRPAPLVFLCPPGKTHRDYDDPGDSFSARAGQPRDLWPHYLGARMQGRAFQQVLAAREARLLEALSRPHSLEELTAQRLIYGKVKEPRFVYDHMEGWMVAQHLDRLLRRGLIDRTPAGFQRLGSPG